MSVMARLDSTALAADPGSEARCTLGVRNTGTVVDELRVEVLGDAAAWATVEPPSVRLFPGDAADVQVTFRPPRHHLTPTGSVPFAVKVSSREDPMASAAEEGALQVGAYHDLTAELIPRTSRGSRRGRHNLVIDNRGNAVVPLNVAVFDPDQLIMGLPSPSAIEAPPGTATFVKLLIKPTKRTLMGPSATRPFQVAAQNRDGQSVTVDGAYLQEPILPPWFKAAVILAVVGLIALTALWFTVLKPTIETAAQDAVEEPLEEQADKLDTLAQQVLGPGASLGRPGNEAGTNSPGTGNPSTGTNGPGGPGVTGGTSATGFGAPTDGRLAVEAAAGNATAAQATLTVPDGESLSISDVVLSNPQGDSGTLQLRRGGDVLLSVQLANFRENDYHFVSPLQFKAGDQLVVSLLCQTPGPPATSCSAAVFFSGFKRLTA